MLRFLHTITAIVAVLPSGVCAPAWADTAFGPVFDVDRTSADLGSVYQGDSARFTFTVTNRGSAPLTLKVTPACGCTLATSDPVVTPGGRGKIEGEIRTAGMLGRVDKEIVARTGDPARPGVVLHVVGTVLADLRVLPADSPVLSLHDNGPTVKEFQVHIADRSAVAAAGVECSQPFVSAVCALPCARTGDWTVFRVALTISPNAPLGRTAVLVTLKTTSVRRPRIPIQVVCEKGILVSPATIYVGVVSAVPPAPAQATRIAILARAEGTFHVLSVSCADPALSVSALPVRAGREYRLTVGYTGGWPAGIVGRDVVINTDDVRQPRIVVRVTAVVSGSAPGLPVGGVGAVRAGLHTASASGATGHLP